MFSKPEIHVNKTVNLPQTTSFSLEPFLGLTDNDRALASKMITLFLKHNTILLKQLDESIVQKDLISVSRITHRFKTSCETFRMTQLRDLLDRCENYHNKWSADQQLTAAENLISQSKPVIEEMKHVLEHLNSQ